jgi:hypothetical protein
MKETPGRRRPKPSDPTDEPVSDPVPLGEDILARHARGRHKTPRRYDEDADEPALRRTTQR